MTSKASSVTAKLNDWARSAVVPGGAGSSRRSPVATVQHGLSSPRHLNSSLGLAGSGKELLLATCKPVSDASPVPMGTVSSAVFSALVTNADGVCSDLGLERKGNISTGIQLSKCEREDAATLFNEVEVGCFVPQQSSSIRRRMLR